MLVAGLGTLGGGSALAVHNLAFELDTGAAGANTVDDTATDPPIDWEDLFKGPGDISPKVTLPNAAFPGFSASGGRADYALPDFSTYATGSKDTLPISPGGASGWQCSKSQNVGDKVDIVNSYATAYINPANNHLILYYGVEKSSPNGDSNIAVWFLKDGTVDCVNTGGGAKNWTGHHKDGDILLVSAFTNGGGTANVNAYRWNGDDTGSISTTAMASGQLCGTGNDDACSVVNNVAISPPWNHPDKDGGALNQNEFFEGGVDAGPFGADSCFATAVANTRSSQSLTATLFDYDRFSLPVCGKLSIQKYIDADLSGTNNAADTNSGADVKDYTFTVTGPSPATTTVCTGTTDNDGKLVCSTGSLENLLPGNYTITETQKTGFFNTDAADGTAPAEVNKAASVSATVAVGVTGGSFKFGNTCYVDKTFEITSVPTGASAPTSITVRYSKNGGATSDLALTAVAGDATKWRGSVNDTFIQTDTIAWDWFINGDDTHKVTGSASEDLSTSGYKADGTGCSKLNTVSFPAATLNGLKYKDGITVNGSQDAGEPGLGGFQFQLKSGATVLATATSSSVAGVTLGTYSFSGVAPGSYTVCEVAKTGWTQTEPASGCRSVTVNLGDTSVTIGKFGNTPLADISVSVNHQTTSTTSTIECKKGADTVASGTNSASTTNQQVGTYVCTVVIVDP
jgi:hypothetical protein